MRRSGPNDTYPPRPSFRFLPPRSLFESKADADVKTRMIGLGLRLDMVDVDLSSASGLPLALEIVGDCGRLRLLLNRRNRG